MKLSTRLLLIHKYCPSCLRNISQLLRLRHQKSFDIFSLEVGIYFYIISLLYLSFFFIPESFKKLKLILGITLLDYYPSHSFYFGTPKKASIIFFWKYIDIIS